MLIETINKELGPVKEYEHHDWQSPTNKLTFDGMHQIEQVWKDRKIGGSNRVPASPEGSYHEDSQ